ncbi:hypothetical protein K0A97_01115 [Patescibacteria group bacterium]|nr:hypothetical protein [Patescibacteria group bacterium]
MKKEKIILGIFLFFFLFSLFNLKGLELENLNESNNTTSLPTLYFFEERGCPDCARQKAFLEEFIKKEYPNIEIKIYSIQDLQNQELFHQMMEERDVEEYLLVVPTLFIEENYFQKFYEADGELIRRAINGENVQEEINDLRKSSIIRVPLIGEVNIKGLNLFLLALIIGSLDGLNVCSIGALILILMIVLSFDSRKKIIFYGGIFILTTALVYGVLVFIWTALFATLSKFIGSINMLVGIAALGGGIYFLIKFIKFCKYGPSCEYSGNKLIIGATNKIQEAFKNRTTQTIFLATSVIIFATVITLVELPCSFGLPMVFGSILAGEGLSWWGYTLYIILYLFFYLLIEIIIFLGAVVTKEIWFSESKFITWIYLAGTLLLFFLSYYYLVGF